MDGSTLEVHNCTERCVQSEERCNPTGPAPCRHKLARMPVNKTGNKTALRMLVHLRQKSMSYSRSDWSAKSSEHVGQQADQTDLPLISLQSRKADQTDLPTITTSHHTFLVINKKWTWVASNECFAHSKCTMAPKGDYYLKNVENKRGRHDVNTSLQPRLSTRL